MGAPWEGKRGFAYLTLALLPLFPSQLLSAAQFTLQIKGTEVQHGAGMGCW